MIWGDFDTGQSNFQSFCMKMTGQNALIIPNEDMYVLNTLVYQGLQVYTILAFRIHKDVFI